VFKTANSIQWADELQFGDIWRSVFRVVADSIICHTCHDGIVAEPVSEATLTGRHVLFPARLMEIVIGLGASLRVNDRMAAFAVTSTDGRLWNSRRSVARLQKAIRLG
jgi:hypothetical protein